MKNVTPRSAGGFILPNSEIGPIEPVYLHNMYKMAHLQQQHLT